MKDKLNYLFKRKNTILKLIHLFKKTTKQFLHYFLRKHLWLLFDPVTYANTIYNNNSNNIDVAQCREYRNLMNIDLFLGP